MCFWGDSVSNGAPLGDRDLPLGRAFTEGSQILGGSEGHAPYSYPAGGSCDPKDTCLDG